MTTIAYRDGIIVADTMVSESGRRCGRAIKIFRRGSVLAGVSGCLSSMIEFRDWFSGGMRGDPPSMVLKTGEDSEAMVVANGLILSFGKDGWDYMRAEYHAIGSGAPLALGAMAVGATAREAVEAAASHCVWTSAPFTVLEA